MLKRIVVLVVSAIATLPAAAAAQSTHELWHMPILLLALITVICTEWGLRRHWRLA